MIARAGDKDRQGKKRKEPMEEGRERGKERKRERREGEVRKLVGSLEHSSLACYIPFQLNFLSAFWPRLTTRPPLCAQAGAQSIIIAAKVKLSSV